MVAVTLTNRRSWIARLVACAIAPGALLARAAGHVVRPWPKGKPVPALALADLDGRRWTLQALRGRPALLNFWATWCEPCVDEMPSLGALAARHAGRLVVLGINYQESEERIRAFLQRTPVGFPILRDDDGDAASAWTPRVFPSTVLLGADGVPLATVLGELDWRGADAKRLLQPLLDGVDGAKPAGMVRTVSP
jgi:thiol-disulfide isomerase/thioredoxin